MGKNISKSLNGKNNSKNVLVMLNNSVKMHLKLVQKKPIKKLQKQL